MPPFRRDIPLLQLIPDAENPRLDDGVPDSLAALQAVMRNKRANIENLAKDIAEEGLDPTLSFSVMATEGDRFIVLEGNRRVTALKLLQNPELANGVLPEEVKRRIKHAAATRSVVVDEVSCVVFPDRETAWPWIWKRHSGPMDGVGLVTWGARERARALRRQGKGDPSLDVYEFVLLHGGLDEEHIDAMREMPFTTMKRMIDDVKVRPILGIEVRDRQVYTVLGRDEVIKGLRRLILDSLDKAKEFNSRSMNKGEDRLKWIGKYAAEDLPSKGAVCGDLVPLSDTPETRGPPVLESDEEDVEVDEDEEKDGDEGDGTGDDTGGESNKDEDEEKGDDEKDDEDDEKDDEKEDEKGDEDEEKSKDRNAPSSDRRQAMLPRTPKLYVAAPSRLNKIHSELSRLDAKKFPNAAAVLFRVFFELSVDTYCDAHGIPKTHKSGGREMHNKLKDKFVAVCDHIEARDGKAVETALKPVRLLMQSSEVLLGGLEHMHQFVHGTHMVPTADVLRAAGDQSIPFLRAIWPQPKKKK